MTELKHAVPGPVAGGCVRGDGRGLTEDWVGIPGMIIIVEEMAIRRAGDFDEVGREKAHT